MQNVFLHRPVALIQFRLYPHSYALALFSGVFNAGVGDSDMADWSADGVGQKSEGGPARTDDHGVHSSYSGDLNARQLRSCLARSPPPKRLHGPYYFRLLANKRT